MMQSNKLLTCFVLFFYCFSLGSLGIRARWIYLLIIVFSFIIICLKENSIIKGKNTFYFRNWMIVYISIVFFILLPNSRHESDIINYLIYLSIITFIYSQIRTDFEEINKLYDIMIFMAVVFSIYIIFARICSGAYRSLVLPFLDTATKNNYLQNSVFGYGPAIGNSYTFGDSVIILGISAVLGKEISKEGGLLKNRLLLLLMISGILLEGRKSELIAIIITIIFVITFADNLRKRDHIELRAFIAVVIGVFLVFAVGIMYKMGLLQRFIVMAERISSRIGGQSVDFTSGRASLWKNAIILFRDNPVFGAGWGRFANYTTGVFREVDDNQAVRDVHNVLLQLLCETGLVGTILICFPLVRVLYYTLKQAKIFRECENNSIMRKSIVFSLSIFIYSFVLSFLDPNFYGHFFWCVLLIAMVFAENSHISYEVLEIRIDSIQELTE